MLNNQREGHSKIKLEYYFIKATLDLEYTIKFVIVINENAKPFCDE